HFDITDKDGDGNTDPVLVKELKISFKGSSTDFNVGDKFDIVPKDGLYWIEPTKGPENITPQIDFNGTDNKNRVTGGSLAAYYAIRDDNCGRYMDKLDAVVSSLIWEVNRIHSQGTGLEHLTYLQGDQMVEDSAQPLGSAQSILPFSDRLQSGNVNFHFYDTETGDYLDSSMLSFAGTDSGNFDPSIHSLNNVVEAINVMELEDGTRPLHASIQDGKLLIEVTTDKVDFALGADSSGLMTALGLNTFFSGHNADTLAVNTQVHSNVNLVAAGQVNGQFQTNVGDNISAVQIGALSDKNVTITTFWHIETQQSLNEYYANLVTTVGADRRRSATNAEYHGTLTADLEERVASVSGVNMDEEMSNLIKFQHSYTAAAKMITTADQMLQTLLGLKQ
ncbi:MAG: flagellar hook-associated protein FlgK, partial [Desulfovibrio sp.]|nr:flagellar hook-associated protein FlgK [Desulfovibrio sp.]